MESTDIDELVQS